MISPPSGSGRSSTTSRVGRPRRKSSDEVGQRGEEGVVPAAYILYIIHQHIKSFQHGGGQPLGVFAIEAEHRQACGGVGILGDERPCRAVAPHTMFGAKQDTQVSGLLQGGNGGAAVTCATRGRSDQTHAGIFKQMFNTLPVCPRRSAGRASAHHPGDIAVFFRQAFFGFLGGAATQAA